MINTESQRQEDIVSILATDVMGWQRQYECDGSAGWFYNNKFVISIYDWNPLVDENHFRMLMEKVMEDEKLEIEMLRYFCPQLGEKNTQENIIRGWAKYIKADLHTRAKALLSALDSLQSK